MQYTVRFNETITDSVLNATGDISNWDSILSNNFFDTWTPNLYAGQVLSIPDTVITNTGNIAALSAYPANNASVPGIYDQLNEVFELMEGLTPIPSQNTLPTVDTNVYYITRPLETIGDAVLNGSGSIENWDTITQANFFDTWTPNLYAGQKIIIPSSATMNLNNFRALNAYPANNASVPDIYQQIDAIFAELNGDLWILRTGYWIDSPSMWIDTAVWID